MTKSWVSGGKNTEMLDELRQEVSDLEARRDAMMERRKRAVFDWCSFVFNSDKAPSTVDDLLRHPMSEGMKEITLEYESLNLQIMEKQVRLNEKLDEQAKYDSLG